MELTKPTKIWVGKGKDNQYGVTANICLSDIPKDLIFEAKNGKKYLTVFINELKEDDENGNRYCLFCLPKQQPKPIAEPQPQATADNDEIPF